MAAVEEGGEDQGFARLSKDLFSGACGGIAQVLIGKRLSRRLFVCGNCLELEHALIVQRKEKELGT
jgi:hypothetical protein